MSPCPRCDKDCAISKADHLRYFLAYRPYACPHCGCSFGPGHVNRVVYLLLGSGATWMALHAEKLRAAVKQDPAALTLMLAGVTGATITGALLQVVFNRTVVITRPTAIDTALHFVSHYILPASLILFGVMSYLARRGGT